VAKAAGARPSQSAGVEVRDAPSLIPLLNNSLRHTTGNPFIITEVFSKNKLKISNPHLWMHPEAGLFMIN
jgi:hypothetical protein